MRIFSFREANLSAKRNSHLDTWRKSCNSSSGKKLSLEVPEGRDNTLFKKRKTNSVRVYGQILSTLGRRGDVPWAWLQDQILLPRGQFNSDAPQYWLSCSELQLLPSLETGEGGDCSTDTGWSAQIWLMTSGVQGFQNSSTRLPRRGAF